MGDIYKAIADPIRRDILNLLKENDLTVNEIVDKFNISQRRINHFRKIWKIYLLFIEYDCIRRKF